MNWYYKSSDERREKAIRRVARWRKQNPDARKREYQRAMMKPGLREKERARKQALDRKKKFGGNWEAALKRDNYQCVICHKPTTTIHHKDGMGYYSKQPNNNLDNLIVCCQSCHMRVFHRDMVKKNLIDTIPWNKGLTYSDKRVFNNMSGIREYWSKHKKPIT